MSGPSLKPTVMFADHVSTLGGASPAVSVISALPRKPTSSKRGYLNGMLIGLMGIVFGLGIMYLLSRLMQVSRRQQQLERQVKDTSLNLDDLALQVHLMASAPKPRSPSPQHATVPTPSSAVDHPIPPPPPPPPGPIQRQVAGFVDFPLPFLFDDGEALLDFFVKSGDIVPPQVQNNTKEVKVEEIVDGPDVRKETDVQSIVQQTMEPIAQVVDALKKQSEKATASPSGSDDDSSSSEEEDGKTKQQPARRSTRATAASRRKK